MARVSTVKEVLESDAETQIHAIRGNLKTLWPIKSGESATGPWSFQNGVLKDATGEVKVVFNGREAVPANWKGRKICILANNGAHGWTGCKTKDEEYPKDSGKFTRVLWVTKSAEVIEDDGSEPKESASESPAAGAARAPLAQHPPPHDTSAPGTVVTNAKVFTARKASGLRITLRATLCLSKEWAELTGEPMPESLFQSLNGCLFIAADRAGMFDTLPVNLELATLQPKAKEAPPKPLPPPKEEPPKPETPPQPEPSPIDSDDVPF